MPTLRPFRALRYDAVRIPQLGDVLCPPYDVIAPDERERLAARHPRNAVRLERPAPMPGEPEESRYRAAARDFVAWRTDGTLHKDARPSIYVHEMEYTDGHGDRARARGFLSRLRLEPFDPRSGVRPHERTMSGPKEDRYQLLKATGANLSPVVLLYDGGRAAVELLERLTDERPTVEAVDRDGTRHRLWVHEAHDEGSAAAELLRVAGADALTIADGHHRYETALRYREERGRNRACESDPPYDYVLALLYDVSDRPPSILATHRVVRGGPRGADLLPALGSSFDIRRCSRDELLAAMASPPPTPDGARGTGRFGVWSGSEGAIVTAREGSAGSDDVPGASELDVARLARVLEATFGIGGASLVGGRAVTYTKDAHEAIALVEGGDADSCFLLDPTPIDAVLAIAAEGGVMPQKSTYFHPKAPTGLVFNALES